MLLTAVGLASAAGCGDDTKAGYRNFKDTAEASLVESDTAGSSMNSETDADSVVEDPSPELETPVDAPAEDSVSSAAQSPSEEATSVDVTVTSDKTGGAAEETKQQAREIKLLVTEKSFVRDRESKALRVSYDDIDLLKVLNMEPVPVDAEKHFPGWLKQLDGQRVRIRGFMYPAYKLTGLTGFMLARDNDICCFRRDPEIYDVFVVRLSEGETTDYIEGRPFDVVGTFHIETEAEDGELLQLYHISEARVVD